MWLQTLIVIFGAASLTTAFTKLDMIEDGILQELINQYDNRIKDSSIQNNFESKTNENDLEKSSKAYDLNQIRFQTRMGDLLLDNEPSIRDQEYLEHSSLWGHQRVQGGAGEGKQRLKPNGSVKNPQVIKSDAILPAYCNPPNPCPLGYTSEYGCIEDFENLASFSKDYQLSQKCICDSEHMFDCLGNNEENQLNSIARSIQNQAISENQLDKLIDNINGDDGHKVVAKKYHQNNKKKSIYYGQEKLPVVAKKSPKFF